MGHQIMTERNLGLDFVRATEAAALAAGRLMGMGRPEEADRAATEAMYQVLNALEVRGRVVVGEEQKLGAPSMLSTGSTVGRGESPAVDVVVDPIDGRRLVAQGRPGAISVVAVAPKGNMWTPRPAVYMEKLVVGPQVAQALVPECLDAPVAWTLALIARVTQKAVRDLVIFVLDRRRHRSLIREIRATGARVMLRIDGDVAGAVMAALGDGKVDALMGIGGVAEGLIAACAVKALGGGMLGRLAPQSEAEWHAVEAAGLDMKRIMRCEDMVKGCDLFFAATGITDGPLLDGVVYRGGWAETHSLLVRCETRTRRFMHTLHQLEPDNGNSVSPFGG
ncbi:MAG: class II fructose-bisphosphatase [Ardenticatenia bacterium]|nr:class II fructose-bisphosphatase [Ardenticatenia bacterium]